jgi:hypothetical protein
MTEWGIEHRLAPVPQRVVWRPVDASEANVRRIHTLWLTLPEYEDPRLMHRIGDGEWRPAG